MARDLQWPTHDEPAGAADPAVRWQVAKYLTGDPCWQDLRDATQTTGWGAQLLRNRGPEGLWDGGLYQPKWTGTFYTLQTLALLGLPRDNASAQDAAAVLLDSGVQNDGQVSLWASRTPDVCVAGMLLGIAVAFGHQADPRLSLVADRLLKQRLPDGGWNCQSTRGGATHSSFHTTISTLEGLAAVGVTDSAGLEFLLQHELFRSHRTGEVVQPGLLSFSFPRYWYYDVLRALSFFASVDAAPDPRINDAIALLCRKRGNDGWWRLGRKHGGRTWLTMERGGQPSAVITLDALRVLRWWHSQPANQAPTTVSRPLP